tara:strand:+ start:275 stop:586 length:312 start_codon:yes stop_codon:yes gene_type:complete
MIPGEIITINENLILNDNSKSLKIKVSNTGDRAIQVGSHFHFFETNNFLKFERNLTRGFRLDIPSGTSVRFEPGQVREVSLIAFKGNRIIFGFNSKIQGNLED